MILQVKTTMRHHLTHVRMPIIKELIEREPLPAPKFHLNPYVKDFYEFTRNDVSLEGYETHPQIENIEVAI